MRQSGQPSLSLDPCQGLAPAVRCPWKQPLRWAWASTLSWSPPASLLPPGLSGRVFLSELLMLLSPWVLTLTSVTNPTSLITLNTLSMPAKPNFLCSPAQTSSLLPAESSCLTSNTKFLVVPKTCSSCVPLHLTGWQLCSSGLLNPQLLSFLFPSVRESL